MKKQIIYALLCMVLLTGCQKNTTNTIPKVSAQEQAADSTQPSIPEAPVPQQASLEPDLELPTSEPPSAPEMTLIMVGDILLHNPVEKSALQEDGTYDFDAIFAHTRDAITDADLALVNQEVIIGGEQLGISGYPCFNAPFAVSDSLVDAGFDIVCHATNHALDKGKAGILSCCQNWEEAYPAITVLGIHDSAEDAAAMPYLYTIKADTSNLENHTSSSSDELTIAILNYTYGTNGIPLPKDMPYAVDLLDEQKVISEIQIAENLADFTIVCPHWGTEYRTEPDAYQKKWTQIFLENGVDLVIGTHPHVIEPVEWVKDEETGHEMLVYYSLGNFVNWTASSGRSIANRMVGGMAKVTITLNEEGNAIISDYGVDALVCHLESGKNGVTTYFLSEYTDELAVKNAIRAQDSSFSKEYCTNLCNQVWGDLWD